MKVIGIKVLSLFDGISCGQLALKRAGIDVATYYVSEIDKNAIDVTQKNFPNTVHLGDINNWKKWDIDWRNIDLLLGGSPCQGFSSSGKELNFNDSRSKLFFVYADILNYIREVNPNIKFLLENVKMKKEWSDIISKHVGVEPLEINSALVSAQNRVRLYWSNFKFEKPKDKNIMLYDILEDKTMCRSAAIRTRPISTEGHRKSLCLEANDGKKSLCLVTVSLNNKLTSMPKGRHLDVNIHKYPLRDYTPVEMCRLQTLPDRYVDGYGINASAKLIGNAWTVDVIAHILSYIAKELMNGEH